MNLRLQKRLFYNFFFSFIIHLKWVFLVCIQYRIRGEKVLVQTLTISVPRLTRQQSKDIQIAQDKHKKAQAVEKILNHKDTQTSLTQPLTISLRRITRQQSIISNKQTL